MKIKEFFKDKNNVILAISASLIVLAVIIAIVATSVEKSRVENKTSEIVSTTNEAENKAPNLALPSPFSHLP